MRSVPENPYLWDCLSEVTPPPGTLTEGTVSGGRKSQIGCWGM